MYEYKILEFLGPVKAQEILNNHAKEGWKLHTFQVYSYEDNKVVVVLERSSSAETEEPTEDEGRTAVLGKAVLGKAVLGNRK